MSSHYTSTHARSRAQTRPGRRRPTNLSRRLLLLRASFIFVFLLLALRLFQIQILDHANYAKLSVAQVKEDLTTTALRAGIYDRHAQILAISRPTSLVIADDFQISHPLREAEAMSPFVKVPVKRLTALLSEKKNGYVVVNNQLDLNDGRKLASAVFPGIVVQNSSVRSYPNGTLAESLIGGTNSSGAGIAGLEYQYQKQLAGQTGITREFVSASGVNLPSSHSTVIKKATPGVGLELTIDSSLQFVAERALAKQLKAVGGLTGVAVVMDVKTGEILADASLVNTKTTAGVLGPISSWGRSVGVAGIDETINNLAFSQAYEPGSVFKVVTFSAALGAEDADEALRVGVRQRTQQDRAHDAEDRRIERDPEREREDHDRREAWRAAELTQGVAQVLKELLDPQQPSRLEIALPGDRHVAERTSGERAGVCLRVSLVRQLLGLQVEVRADLGRVVGLTPFAPPSHAIILRWLRDPG